MKTVDQRRSSRRDPQPDEPLARMRMRAGREVRVINLGSTGALVEGEARLLPGVHVEVHVVTRAGRVLVRSRVARAYVCDLTAESIRYRAGLAFETAVDTTGYVIPVILAVESSSPGSAYPGQPPRLVTGEDNRETS